MQLYFNSDTLLSPILCYYVKVSLSQKRSKKLNNWIKAVFFLSGKLSKLEKILQESMEKLSTNMSIDTYSLCNQMLLVEDKLRRVCNFKVLSKMLCAHLPKDDTVLIKRHIIAKQSFADIAAELGVHKSTPSRKFNKAIEACVKFCEGLTFNLSRFEKDYKDIPLITETVKMFNKNI